MKIHIPDAATEAAAKMIAGIEQTDWERWEDIAEHALRAAAPFLLAQAWDEGYTMCEVDSPYEPDSPNPYRSAK